MNYSLVDTGGVCLAVLAYVPLLLGPGLALGELFDPFGFRKASPAMRLALATMIALAAMPVIDTLATKLLGLEAAVALNLAMAAVAAVLALRRRDRVGLPLAVAAALAAWLLVMLAEWVEFDVGGGLYRSFTVIDMVKHAATVQAIHDTGAPPADPFFARPGRVGYYYFFYTLAALCQQLCGGLASARAAMGGLAVWTGVGAFALCRTVLDRSGLLGPSPSRRVGWTLLATMGAGGLDILMTLRKALTEGVWLPDPVWWNEQVTGWLESLLWVPHHVTGLIAGFCGLMILADTPRPGRAASLRSVGFAALCFASALGLSVWVTAGAVATAAVWMGLLVVERRWAKARDLALAGLGALVLALPFLLDLNAGRAPEHAAAISLAVRDFAPVETIFPHPGLGQPLARLVCLPINYLMAFGLLFAGTLLFWSRRRSLPPGNEASRLLALSAAIGLLIGSFAKSNLYNNDLGWRIMLFPILAGTVWTVAAVEGLWSAQGQASLGARLKALPALTLLFAAIGLAGTAYALVSLRAYPFMATPEPTRFVGAHPETDRELRAAYEWANLHLPPRAVLQHNPAPARAFAFGLYGRNPTGVGDAYASLYGASEEAVTKRLHEVFPIFEANSPTSDVRARALWAGVDDLIVTADDPVWSAHADWVWRSRPVYATPRVRIIPVAALEGGA